jgi:hypothetical protein
VVVFLIKWYGIHGRRIVVHACGDDDDEVKNNKLVSFAARYDYKQKKKKTKPIVSDASNTDRKENTTI